MYKEAKAITPLDRPSDFKPVAEIALFEARGEKSSYFHALVAKLTAVDGSTERGPWRDLTEEDVIALRKAFQSMGGLSTWGLLPARVLSVKPGGCCWWSPAARRPLMLSPKLAKQTGLPQDGECNWPGLVFFSGGERLSVFALKEEERPCGDTPLYSAPFWNVFPGGGVCMGSARITAALDRGVGSFIADADAAFFRSQFDHGGAALDGLTLEEAWRIAQAGPFPVQNLIPIKATLAQTLAQNNF